MCLQEDVSREQVQMYVCPWTQVLEKIQLRPVLIFEVFILDMYLLYYPCKTYDQLK